MREKELVFNLWFINTLLYIVNNLKFPTKPIPLAPDNSNFVVSDF